MARLKLGSLPDDRPVRVSITIPADLKCALDAYAAAYAVESGRQWETKKLIPHIFAAFLRSDKAFARRHLRARALGGDGSDAPG